MRKKIILTTVKEPMTFLDVPPVFLTEETMEERKNKLITRMKEEGIDTLVIYADKEHGANFEYLTGFIPRFEEGLLVVEASGNDTLIVGNENLKMHAHSRISTKLIHYPPFSLPNQPMTNEESLAEIFATLGFKEKNKIGLIGWKMFTTQKVAASKLFDLPYFIVEAIRQAIDAKTELINAAYLMIGENGVRRENNANELAHYEYGANLASRCMLNALNKIEVGIKEVEVAEQLNGEGQTNTVVTIAATGTRFDYANLYPTHKKIKQGDALSLTTGFKGGLSSRTGFVVEKAEELPVEQADYLERVAKPYFKAIVTWLENLRVGLIGKEMYQLIESVLPKQLFHWHLNPGHLTADEEWMASPIYEDSTEYLVSGMIFQLDIIPSVPGYTGVSAEECVAIADEVLRTSIKENYPELWERICIRRNYLEEELNICLNEAILPLSNTVAYLRPFYLAKTKALRVKNICGKNQMKA
ncbi:aminopeptidase P family protein [Enterococcus durans]|uniref:M24 family metallopeptidase n=1 Tax=Enterococcus durans TaxID=53345 RepID=UPI003D6C6DA8